MFSNTGKVYMKKCYEIPEAGRTAKGTNLVNVLSLSEGEKITAIIPIKAFTDDEYLVMVTKLGVTKRIALSEYNTRRSGGLFAINLDEGDELLFVMKTTGYDSIMIASHNGLGIRFEETEVRSVGRQARGVRGINLAEDDYVVGAASIMPNDDGALITITEKGFGKRCDAEEYALQNRGGKGMICHRIMEKTGKLAGIAYVHEDEDIMLITNNGIIIRTAVDQIPVYGRNTGGVIVMRLDDESTIMNFAAVKKTEEDGEQENQQ
jgi:DNA gyrase subunit A